MEIENCLDNGIKFLNREGLNLVSILPAEDIPEFMDSIDQGSLILVGNGGSQMWERIIQANMKMSDHPFDRFTQKAMDRFFHQFLPKAQIIQLFPSDNPIPLQRLGEYCGWCSPSLLGLGIHPKYGTWFGYRGLYSVDITLPKRVNPPSHPFCKACSDKTCVEHCISGSVQPTEYFLTNRCMENRLQPNSDCAFSCPARISCPVGTDHQYSTDQMIYHGQISMQAIKKYSSI